MSENDWDTIKRGSNRHTGDPALERRKLLDTTPVPIFGRTLTREEQGLVPQKPLPVTWTKSDPVGDSETA